MYYPSSFVVIVFIVFIVLCILLPSISAQGNIIVRAPGDTLEVQPLFHPDTKLLTLEDYTFEFVVKEASNWALAHILHPFIIQMIFQDARITMLFVFGWEFIETLFLASIGSLAFFIGDVSELDTITDSLIGDIVNGLLGVWLGSLFIIVFKVPMWMPSAFGVLRKIWMRRILFYIAFVPSFIPYNFFFCVKGLTPFINFGILFAIVWHVVVLSLFWIFFNNTPLEGWAIWGKHRTRRDMDLIYLSWMTLLVLMQYVNSYYVTYEYYQVWIVWTLAIIILLLLLAAQGRLWEVPYFMTLQYRKVDYYYKHQIREIHTKEWQGFGRNPVKITNKKSTSTVL